MKKKVNWVDLSALPWETITQQCQAHWGGDTALVGTEKWRYKHRKGTEGRVNTCQRLMVFWLGKDLVG